jgi:hypothetical protein
LWAGDDEDHADERFSNDGPYTMMHHHGMPGADPLNPELPSQPGQAAFAAIQEIMQILEADQQTDWSSSAAARAVNSHALTFMRLYE